MKGPFTFPENAIQSLENLLQDLYTVSKLCYYIQKNADQMYFQTKNKYGCVCIRTQEPALRDEK